MKTRFERLLQHLPTGKEHAVSMTKLADTLGISSRSLRKMILNARKAGIIILSGMDGYYLPEETDSDMLRYFKQRHKAGISTLSALAETRKRLKEAGSLEGTTENGTGTEKEKLS